MPNQYGIVEKIERVCQHCGETFYRCPSQLIGKGQGKFCSRSCMASSRTGEKNSCWRGGKSTRVCPKCGVTFVTNPAAPQRHCSRACGYRSGTLRGFPSTAPILTCRGCGKGFSLKPSAVARGYGKFCSRTCMHAHPEHIHPAGSRWGGRDYTCKQCGKVFHDQIDNKTGGRKFCSQQCRANYWGPRWRGSNSPCWKGTSKYGRIAEMARTEYKEWRKAVFERDDYTCQTCGKRGGRMHGHHILGWADHPALRYSVGNGQTLCSVCHGILHNIRFNM